MLDAAKGSKKQLCDDKEINKKLRNHIKGSHIDYKFVQHNYKLF